MVQYITLVLDWPSDDREIGVLTLVEYIESGLLKWFPTLLHANTSRLPLKCFLSHPYPIRIIIMDDGPVTYSNIMFDRRVIRGSTFAQHPIPTDEGETQAARQHEARRRALARRRAQADQYKNKGRGTPPPVTGRRHENVQTEKFLEELLERPSETEASCQTDPFLDRPVSPPFIPAVVTAEAETQVYPGEVIEEEAGRKKGVFGSKKSLVGKRVVSTRLKKMFVENKGVYKWPKKRLVGKKEVHRFMLFDFNGEVEPILDLLVGKTLEQSIAEVIEEEQEMLKALQHGEQMGQQTKKEVQDKQKSGANEDSEAENDSSQGVLSLEYLPETLPDVLAGLKHAGYNINDIKTDFGEDIMPWLLKEVQNELKHMVSSKDILTDIVREIVETRGEVYRVMKDEDAEILDLGSDDESAKKDEETREQEENLNQDLENVDKNIASDETNKDMEQMEDCEISYKNQRELESKMSEHNKEDLDDNKEIVDEEDTNNDLKLSARVEENETGSVKHLIPEISEIEDKKTQDNGEVES
ncbi:unnamed protein product [Timema podura]|uniref:Uncharacterized protein n=1 Tax=Timema podura TaxID=61482 RepID=A0ABN7NDI2_TIMPD|nr:unnamed protein product [Timema podura]